MSGGLKQVTMGKKHKTRTPKTVNLEVLKTIRSTNPRGRSTYFEDNGDKMAKRVHRRQSDRKEISEAWDLEVEVLSDLDEELDDTFTDYYDDY